MDSLTHHQFNKLRQRFSKGFFEDPVSQSYLANKDFIHSFVEKYPLDHVLATPLLEVFSVRISNHAANNGDPYEVYGTIQISDGQGFVFTIYDRNADIPEIVCNGDALTLFMPKGRPITITPSNVVTVKINLRARIGDIDEEIINERQSWEFVTIDDFDKVKTDEISGLRGLAVVDYVSYRHAIFTTVEVILVKGTDDETCKSALVYGTIVADCGNRYSTVIFDKKQNDSVVVEYGTCIELSRHVVAVPAWSSFTIYADLWNADANQKIVDKTDKQSNVIPLFIDLPYGIEIKGQNGLIEVRVEWGHVDLQQPHSQRNVEATSEEESEYDVIPDQQTLLALNNTNSPSYFSHVSDWETSSLEVWEVFSISVYSNSDQELNLWGSIDAYSILCRRPIFTFFERKSPQRLLPNQTIPIEFPTSCIKSPAIMTLNLVVDDGHVISKGDICWEDQTFEYCTSCLNRLLCSVVPGEDGYYATVHYIIFPVAFEARVKICLVDKTSSLKNTKVNGCIRAQYGEFTYVTPYEKESYRRKLFVGRLEDPSLQFSDSKIPLSESVIAVGEDFTLIVDVNLEVFSDYDKVKIDDVVEAGETFNQQLLFSPDMDCEEKFLERRFHQIVVYVEWSEL